VYRNICLIGTTINTVDKEIHNATQISYTIQWFKPLNLDSVVVNGYVISDVNHLIATRGSEY
jgi:hypothetical protein